jgi:hypothetical protein
MATTSGCLPLLHVRSGWQLVAEVAQRLRGATIEEWFERLLVTVANATLIEVVGKRLVAMYARTKLA